MREIRKIERIVEWYDFFVWGYPEEIKKDKKEALMEIKEVEEMIDELFNYCKNNFQYYCEICSEIFFLQEKNILIRLKCKVEVVFIGVFLDKYAKRMKRLSKLKMRNSKIKERVIQINYFS